MRALPFFIDMLFLTLFVAFMVTQVITPLWRDRPLFPMFRKERRQAHDALSGALEKSDVLELKRRVKSVNSSNRKG